MLAAEERKRLLSFVVVGGGPTGVEFSAELHDFLYQDVRRLFPDVYSDIQVRLVEGREILSSFDASLRDWAKARLTTEGVELVTGAFVVLATEPSSRRMDHCEVDCIVCVNVCLCMRVCVCVLAR